MFKAFLLVVVGLSGTPEHGETFHKWGNALAEASAKLGVTGDRLAYLVNEKTEADTKMTGISRREEIDRVLASFAKQATAEDVVFVVLIGHGSAQGERPLFNLPGQDVGPTEFNTWFRRLPTRNIVFVNTSPSSGPWVEELSAPGRTVITATRNASQQFTTLFGGRFVEALTTTEADGDKNQRISMLEAFTYARDSVKRSFEQEGLLATEQALLDDNGDKQGSQEPTPTGADGKLAATLALGSAADAQPLPDDPKLRAVMVEQRELERRVEALRLLRDSMDPAKYAAELERLVTELALKTRERRTLEGSAGR
jgi:hypothetical protein